MHYTVTLTCSGCKATLRYEDERPPWQTYDYRVEQADECERSAKFVSENIDKPLPPFGEAWPSSLDAAWTEAGCPRFINDPDRQWRGYGIQLTIPDPYEYVTCPVCDRHVKKP